MSSSGLPYTDLFAAVEAGALASLHALLFGFKMDSLAMREAHYTLLTEPHPQNGLTVLQFAIENYPQSSIKIVKALLEYGAGTELVDHSDSHGTPLWIAIKRKVDIEIIRSLLEYKADIFFKSNCSPFTEDEKGVIMNRDQDGFSILHLAVKVACNENILKLLIDSSGDSLLNDQSNRFRETPLSNIKFVISFVYLNLNLSLLSDCGKGKECSDNFDSFPVQFPIRTSGFGRIDSVRNCRQGPIR